MEVSIHRLNQHATIIEITGELDMHNTSKLKKIVRSLWKKEHIPLILDLKHLIFIDSSGIGILLYFYSQMTKRKQPFYLVNLCNAVQTVLKLTGIQDLLPIANNIDSAMSQLP